MIRQPVVAGLFYPSSASELKRQLTSFVSPCVTNKRKTIAAILPHAGYIYSGDVVGEVIADMEVPERVVLLGPNHHGWGEQVAVSAADAWATPLGTIPLATDLRVHLLNEVSQLTLDDRPHAQEHSLEVLLPFLQHVQPQLNIVPIALKQLDLAESLALGESLAQAIGNWHQPVLLIASSDMNHFLPVEENAQLDARAIDAMTRFDVRGLYQVVDEWQISMCGVLPVVTVMAAAKLLGAQRCELVRYSHSGLKSGDNHRVVGYAGLVID